ncbi:hypothetical protein Lcho_1399 [Leptothrix cholodnii SP-6]|uniref:BioF2-like acetyltransferase domain-containing protein n=1 Tax=Leptothrix cholodnii (strain ATCC 51168 / LMG 8142 / SP-6) TaxID=395495 RepID=B1Y740_LEPCP|nr:hypothetical protein Lcho_1399 [Leptothrix cholodnii SP-6]
MSVSVEDLSPENDAQVCAFLDALGRHTPEVLAYHYPFYRDMLAQVGAGTPVYLGARCDGELVGLLPAFMHRGELGATCTSLPFFGPNAGVLCSAPPGALWRDIHAALLEALIARARQADAWACSVCTPFLSAHFERYDAAMPQALVVERSTQYQMLQTLADTQHAGALARNLRKAEAAGIEICTEPTPERVECFYAIYRQNCDAHGIPLKPRIALDRLMSEGLSGRHARVSFAYRAGEMLAGLLVLVSPRTVSYYTPCTRAEDRALQPGVLLIDRAMRTARAAGQTHWNWESSPGRDSGVYRFKQKWGAREAGYRTYVMALRDEQAFRQLGRQRLAAAFPWHYVYPFDRL